MRSLYCQDKETCPQSHCLRERTTYIYGLYDNRLRDIFYVGSTFYPAERFAQHLRGAKDPYTYKSMWIHDILERGSFPLPLLLHEFQTMCDQYTRQVEQEIAARVRAEGHTALCDWYGGPICVKNYMSEKYPSDTIDWRISRPVEVNLWAEYIDRTAESARIDRLLQEMYQYG